MDHVLTNWTVPVEIMTMTVLIVVGVLVKAIRNLSKRLLRSQVILETDSLTLSYQTQRSSLPQELQQQEQQGVDENGNGNNDDGRISESPQRPQF